MTPRPRINTTCCKCGAPITAAINRRNNSMCECCRKAHVEQYNANYGRMRRTSEYKAEHKQRSKRYYIDSVRILIPESPTCPVCRKPFDSRLLCACKMSDEQARLDYQQRFAGNGRGAYRRESHVTG